MATFLLLHGSFHAAWNWHRVLPLLEAAGHRGVAIDLPAHGRDRTPARRVTLDACVKRVLDELDEPAVLVAHRRNGIVISEVAERAPDRVQGLVYLAAYLVPSGRAMIDYTLHDPSSLVVQNVGQPLPSRRVARLLRSGVVRWLARMLLPERLQTHSLAKRAYREALYHDCPDDITELANVLLEPEPTLPGFTPLRLTPERYGRVPKVYIECLQDRAVTLDLQRRMQRDTPCDRVISLDSGHSPFFSQPAALVAALLEAFSGDVVARNPAARAA
jgi:pimeloyl-ACP methyl ester carboxylesterase